MINSICLPKSFQLRKQAGLVLLVLLQWAGVARAQFLKAGDISPDFTLMNRKTGQPLRLSDYKGTVLFLDFFAYW